MTGSVSLKTVLSSIIPVSHIIVVTVSSCAVCNAVCSLAGYMLTVFVFETFLCQLH